MPYIMAVISGWVGGGVIASGRGLPGFVLPAVHGKLQPQTRNSLSQGLGFRA